MISVEEARARILAALAPTAAEWVALSEAAGRVLAESALARRTQPPADLSAMDGYAARADDVVSAPAELAVIGEAPAGRAFDGEVGAGEAVRIFTGGPLPNGADTIVIQENTEPAGPGRIRVTEAATTGRHIRKAGIDFAAGESVLAAGTRLAPRHIGLAASADLPWLAVHRQPRIAVLATGDELVRPGEPVGHGRIVQSATPALAAFIQARGGVATDLGIARDEAQSLQTLSKGAQGADCLVTVGGASVGDYDLVRSGLGEIGLELDFWKIAQRPGKPLIFGQLGAVPLIGLPGNPVSALVCALLYLGPAIDVLSGTTPRLPVEVVGRLAEPIGANKQREAFLSAEIVDWADGRPLLRVMNMQDSSVQSALAHAGALLIRQPGAEPAEAGSTVRAYLLDPGGGL